MRARVMPLTLLLAVMLSSAAHAACTPTPFVGAHGYPGARNIPTMNDLTRYSGKAEAAMGQQLIVHGRVRDRNCVPIAGAMVEMWQVNPYGKFRIPSRAERVNPDPVFNGAGRTYTDNNGGFTFITLFPAASHGAPHLNFRIRAQHMPVYSTVMYFSGDERNTRRSGYRTSLEMNVDSYDRGRSLVAAREFILPGKVRYRTY